MGKKSGGGGAFRGAGGGVSGGRMRGGGGGSAADTLPVSTGSYAGVVLYAWSKLGKYVVRPIARALYGNQKKYKIAGERVGQRAYQRYQRARRANLAIAAATGGIYVPPTEAEWKRRAEAVNAPRPRKTPSPPPPTRPPPPPPPTPRPPPRPQLPRGFTRQSIVAYVVANGVVWAVDKAGRWWRDREATPEETRTGTVGGGPRRGGPRGAPPSSEPLTPVQIFQKRIPVPRVRAPAPKRPVSPALEPIVITAQRLPVPAPAVTSPAWLKIIKAIPGGANPLELFKGKRASKASRQLGRALTALETQGVTSTLNQTFSSFSGGGGTPTQSKRCQCPKKRKSKPKKPRTICYKGSYTETATGLSKRKREKIPCQSSPKK